MEMIIHLDDEIFELVKNGAKTVEGRVNDEKRRKLNILSEALSLSATLTALWDLFISRD